jgi:hypothetical protein
MGMPNVSENFSSLFMPQTVPCVQAWEIYRAYLARDKIIWNTTFGGAGPPGLEPFKKYCGRAERGFLG